MIIMPVSKENTYASIEKAKHLNQALRFIPITSKSYGTQRATLAGQEETTQVTELNSQQLHTTT